MRRVGLSLPIWLLGVLIAGTAAPQLLWQTYVDPVYGTRLDYPANLFENSFPVPGGIVFTGPGVTLEISVVHRPEVQSIRDLERTIDRTPGYEAITYRARGERWLVVSGYRGENIYYDKYFLSAGLIHAFGFEYPIASRQIYDPVVEVIEDTFRAGN
jgi:hypothetical protein